MLTYIIPSITSPLSAGCVLRSDAMLATACKVAGADVLERPSFAPSEMLVPRQCVPRCGG